MSEITVHGAAPYSMVTALMEDIKILKYRIKKLEGYKLVETKKRMNTRDAGFILGCNIISEDDIGSNMYMLDRGLLEWVKI